MGADSFHGSERLLVLTNRLPFSFRRGRRGLERRSAVGGLASALDPVLRKRGGTWVGWPGIDFEPGEDLELRGSPYRIRPIGLSETELARYHHGLSNRMLWPLFHSFPGRAHFDRLDWPVYEQVNLRFAEAALHEAQEADLVWVHDYHLLRTPFHLRRALPEVRLAFFLHIPFPTYDIFRLLPRGGDLLRGMLACDLVGFHVESYARNFLDCVERLLGVDVSRQSWSVEFQGRVCRVGAFPIGIDFDRFASMAREGAASRLPRRERIILAADRLDYTKGISERIVAIEHLLEAHPEYQEKVVLFQIAVPSRSPTAEYSELKREIEELVGRVNGRFGTATWSPIRYLYQLLGHEQLAALYRDADVMLATPLRDGMNLVAEEFVACQVGDPGVLILSRLAGAAETMHEALLVNPYDVDQVADVLDRALRMEETERRTRMDALRARERSWDVHAWVEFFLGAAQQAATEGGGA